jgi:hypothetical protein
MPDTSASNTLWLAPGTKKRLAKLDREIAALEQAIDSDFNVYRKELKIFNLRRQTLAAMKDERAALAI